MVASQTMEAIALLQQAFPSLSSENLQMLSEVSSFGAYQAGQDIVREGEHGTTLYILGEGHTEIIVHADDGHEILVDTIGPGTYFGEMSFFGESTRMATIRAKTDCETLELEQSAFMEIAQTKTELLQNLLNQIIGHLRRNDRAVIRELNIKNQVIQDAYADLAEQEELRSQFIATLSHELRTPLTSIRGFLGLINQGAITGESLKVAVRSVTRNVESMVGLVNNMLILYEMSPGASSYDYLNPSDVVVQALNATQSAIEGTPPLITLNIADDLPQIYADKNDLVLALRALIENAVKFTPDRQPVNVKVFCPSREEVAFCVQDQGIGIPEDAHERIFEPFFRLEELGSSQLFPGLGIGLTIAKLKVERLNGRIHVESTPGKGSTFTITLPLQ
ncbi:MAG: cyclic nucleotide-binding domain-containing protein [Ardenticatenaceae bacterium]|nr:cyclic nucleotide-binding domain-containing protein [Anaerolineales bacterium]MCB8923216.1 cyclic nucleotide-binding domain-containing protein [Ardenticatenaceae bacterium]MCB9004839.1 cyclic nucleotide-binding domain-containing protein [Ardenticatenaceae bacterium]